MSGASTDDRVRRGIDLRASRLDRDTDGVGALLGTSVTSGHREAAPGFFVTVPGLVADAYGYATAELVPFVFAAIRGIAVRIANTFGPHIGLASTIETGIAHLRLE